MQETSFFNTKNKDTRLSLTIDLTDCFKNCITNRYSQKSKYAIYEKLCEFVPELKMQEFVPGYLDTLFILSIFDKAFCTCPKSRETITAKYKQIKVKYEIAGNPELEILKFFYEDFFRNKESNHFRGQRGLYLFL